MHSRRKVQLFQSRHLPTVLAALLLSAVAWDWAAGAPAVDSVSPHPGGTEIAVREQIIFTDVMLNGQPAVLALDTGASGVYLTQSGALRLGLRLGSPLPDMLNRQSQALSLIDDVRLQVGPQVFTGRLPVIPVGFIPHDGIIGWPEIENSILVFDAVHHRVRTVDRLPPETAAWLKLKIQPAPILTLETSLPDGTTGTLVVDTGSPFGLGLPHNLWEKWRTAHLHAASNTLLPLMVGTAEKDRAQAWADEISLAGLTLVDVPVYDENSGVYSENAHWVGTLGLYALSRMDLVVDRKGGYAYLHPRSGPGAPYPELARPGQPQGPAGNTGWQVEGVIPMNLDRMQSALASISGQAKQAKGDTAGALADFNAAIKLDPDNYEAYVSRGDARMLAKDFDNALADFDRAVAIYPGTGKAFYKRFLLDLLKNDRTKALADINRFLELDPNNLEGYKARTQLKLLATDWTGALADAGRLLELAPRDGEAYFFRALARINTQDLSGAVADYNHALEYDPRYANNAEFYFYRGLIAKFQKNFGGAIADFDRAIALDSKNSSFYQNRADAKYSHGDLEGALADYGKTLERDPKNAAAYEARSRIYQIQGNFPAALADSLQVVKLQPAAEYSSLAVHLLQQRLGQPTGDLRQKLAQWKDGWSKSLAQFLIGEIDETALLAGARQGDAATLAGRQCEAFYYIGMQHFLRGDLAGARECWHSSLATRETEYDEYQWSGAEIKRLPATGAN